MTREEQDENEFEEWSENVWKPTPREAWLASRRLLRENIQKRSSEFMRAFMEGEMEGKDG